MVSDGLGSVAEALDGSGDVTFQQLFTPYGAARYSQGGSPTSDAFTGQRSDSQTGLDYFNARYYDPSTQTFISADTVSDGLNRYAYAHDNPETLTDPSGHRAAGCVQEDGAWYCPTTPPPPAPGGTPPGCHGGCQTTTGNDGGCVGQCKWANAQAFALRFLLGAKSVVGLFIGVLKLALQINETLQQPLMDPLQGLYNLASTVGKIGEVVSLINNAVGLIAALAGAQDNGLIKGIMAFLGAASGALNGFAGSILTAIGAGAGFWSFTLGAVAGGLWNGVKAWWNGVEDFSWAGVGKIASEKFCTLLPLADP